MDPLFEEAILLLSEDLRDARERLCLTSARAQRNRTQRAALLDTLRYFRSFGVAFSRNDRQRLLLPL